MASLSLAFLAFGGAAAGQSSDDKGEQSAGVEQSQDSGSQPAQGDGKTQAWTAVEPPSVEQLRKQNPNLKVQILVVSQEEIANQGVRGNGRIIYRVVNGILQIVLTDPAAAASLAQLIPDLAPQIVAAVPASAEAVEAVTGNQSGNGNGGNNNGNNGNNGNGGNNGGNSPFDDPGPGTNGPPDFVENPNRDNISPS
ncbi:hypothetical protein [Novosphingobium jiangmenense]|uniref:Uncharacterized protein n=1 Tax=Novosphingobium jiangmenense TaxID=2791981 RepID=A0ABS0HBL4_9SPHN|nr:hypothetical protein [Novosphingobium jiangmenense]MBF9149671.1 hypothetical protein [Novosphingobium jiangmenense]